MGGIIQDPNDGIEQSSSNVDTRVSGEYGVHPRNSALAETSPQNLSKKEELTDDKKRNTAYRLYDVEYHLRLASTLEPKKIKLYINIIEYLLKQKGQTIITSEMIHEFKNIYNDSALFGIFEMKHSSGKIIRNPIAFRKYRSTFKDIIRSFNNKKLLETKNTNTGKQIIVIENPERLEELLVKLKRIFDDKTGENK